MLKHFPTAWRKALRDLWLNKARAFLVVLSIAIGVFGLGLVANSYAILVREMDVNYLRTNPAAATIYTTALDDDFLQQVKDLPQVDEVEARSLVIGRVQTGENEWKTIWLFVVADFENLRLDKFSPEAGQYPAKTGEILLERDALKVANAEIGQTLGVKIPNAPATALQLVGSIHAPGLAPAWMENFAYGFITRETLVQLGGDPALNELKVTFVDKSLNQNAVRAAATDLRSWMETQGHPVSRIEVPKPGKHPHATQMATLLFLLEVFGVIALLLSAVLVVNMISALLAQQIRQIGVMKAIGAHARQVTGIYYGMVLLLGLAGLSIGLPLAILAGRGYAAFAAKLLNFQIFSDAIPWPTLALQVLVGLLAPLLAASYPILRGSRISVREAMSDYGIAEIRMQNAEWSSAFSRLQSKIKNLQSKMVSRPFALSLRNTFRQRGRLLLTLGTLAVGGAGFIVAMNVSASATSTVDAEFAAQKYDIQTTFTLPYPEQELERQAKSVAGVARVESWGSAQVVRVQDNGTESNKLRLLAPPEHTDLMTTLPLLEGRWLAAGDTNALVANHALLGAQPDLKVGDEVILRIAGKETTWKLVGVVQEMMFPPTVYMTRESLNAALGWDGLASALVVATNQRDVETVAQVSRRLESQLAANGFDVYSSTRMADYRKIIEDHLLVLSTFLVLMSILVLMVGGLGLGSTMSINILERTREIGVLRAIGASSGSILKIIVAEGAIIGALSWVLALIISWPVSSFVSYTFGITFFEAPLRLAVSVPGILLWLGVSTGFAALASLYPAWSATQLTVRQILAYE
jgi:putative ABC transport system permease protein